MYMVIRRSSTQAGKMDEAAKAVEEGELWPVISSVPGFVEYYFMKMGEVGFSVSLFETQEAAEESTRRTMDYIRQSPIAASIMQGAYEVVAKGEVPVHKVKQA